MAEISEGFMGNATGGIGQGLAYVLPDTKSEDYAMQLAQQHSQQLAAQAAARLKRQQALADQVRKDFRAQKLPDYYAPFDKKINEENTKWQKKAADYSTTTGKSPFSNPDLMNEYNVNVLGTAKKSKEFGDTYAKSYGLAVADGGKNFTPESVQEVFKFKEVIDKDPLAAMEQPMPRLVPKGSTITDFVKTVTPTAIGATNNAEITTRPNIAAIQTQVIANAYDPKFAGLLTEAGFDPSLPNFPIYDKPGSTNMVFPTDAAYVEKKADEILSRPDKYPEITSKMNLADPDAKERLKIVIKNQNETFGGFVKNATDVAAAKVKQDTKPNYEDDRLALAKRNASRLESNAAAARMGGGGELTDKPLPLGTNNPDGTQAVVQGKNGLSFTTPTMNMIGAKIIDANTGTPFESADSSNDIAIAGLVQAPILNRDISVVTTNDKTGAKTKTTLKAGSIVQPDYADKYPGNVSYKKVGVGQKPKTSGKGFTTVYVDAATIPQNGFSKKSQADYDAFMGEPTYQRTQKQSGKSATSSSTPKKGQTMAVQGGTAIFDGTKWVMKQ